MAITQKIIGIVSQIFGIKTKGSVTAPQITIPLAGSATGLYAVTTAQWLLAFAGNSFGLFQNNLIRFTNTVALSWASGPADSTNPDAGLSRVVGGVVAPTLGTVGTRGYMQNPGGDCVLAADFPKTNATLGSTNLSDTVVSGRDYTFEALLIMSNTVPGEGGQIAIGGTATAKKFVARADAKGGTVVAVNEVSAALATVINYSTITETTYVRITGYLKCNAGGTFILQAAENTTATGTFTLAAGSWIKLTDILSV